MSAKIIYSGKASSKENAVSMAEGFLGQVCGKSSDGVTFIFSRVSKSAVFRWTENQDHISCKGLPSISLPCSFVFESEGKLKTE